MEKATSTVQVCSRFLFSGYLLVKVMLFRTDMSLCISIYVNAFSDASCTEVTHFRFNVLYN